MTIIAERLQRYLFLYTHVTMGYRKESEWQKHIYQLCKLLREQQVKDGVISDGIRHERNDFYIEQEQKLLKQFE